MTEIGSPDWIEQQSRRLEGLAVDPALRIVIQQTISNDTATSWHVTVADGSARLIAGRHPAPDVTLTSGRATAMAIAEGRASPQREFLDGRLRIGGDIAALMDGREALALLVARGPLPT